MTNFNDGAPTTPEEYLKLSLEITPCNGKRPIIPHWPTHKADKGDFKSNNNIGLKMTGLTDIDCDNHFVKRFIGKYLLSPASTFGRKSNPCSHYIFSGEVEYKMFSLPDDFKDYCKSFPHGTTLLELRSGNGHQTIAPGSVNNGEKVEWQHWVGFQKYVGDIKRDVGKIALSTALSILYPPKGNRDNYCTAIAGVLKNHTEWSANEINQFVYNIASLSGKDENAGGKMAKGTNAYNDKTRNFGLPKLAEILNCSVGAVAKLFEWVGIKDSASQFTDLRVYHTDPKYWIFKFRGHDITLMDTSLLLSYTKIKILILENTLQEPPELKPAEWKSIRMDLLRNVKEIETPQESSYYGMVGAQLTEWAHRYQQDDDGIHVITNNGIIKSDKYKGYVFKLEGLIMRLKRAQMTFEARKLTQYLRSQFGAEPIKITLDKKEFRVWKISYEAMEDNTNYRSDIGVKLNTERLDKNEKEHGYRFKVPEPY
jgi:hypothetical protein